jgi:uncharacterized membrane protein
MDALRLLPLHVIAGCIGILSGFIALYVLKGAALHRKSGMVFVYAMLAMSLTGAIMAIGRAGAATNIPAGLVTAYLVVTGIATVRRPTRASRRFDRAAMVAAFAFGLTSIALAVSGAAERRNALTVPLLMFGAIAVLAGGGDLRMIRRGGLQGRERLRRHLWRMCTALFVAAASFFYGPVRRIPEPLRAPGFRLIPLLVLATMVYWLWRYRRTRNSARVTTPEAI